MPKELILILVPAEAPVDPVSEGLFVVEKDDSTFEMDIYTLRNFLGDDPKPYKTGEEGVNWAFHHTEDSPDLNDPAVRESFSPHVKSLIDILRKSPRPRRKSR
jgi:hypothetical protein